jgi:antitoxin PrlF
MARNDGKLDQAAPQETAMFTALEFESTLSDHNQTNLPYTVRQVLKLEKGDKIRYTIQPDGSIHITRAEPAVRDDPALGRFLSFLARDIAAHPERVQALDAELVTYLQTMTQTVQVDLNAPLSAADE